LKAIAFILAIVSLAVAGYAVYSLGKQADEIQALQSKASALEASIGGLINSINENRENDAYAQKEAQPAPLLERVVALEQQVAGQSPALQTGRSSKEELVEGSREMIRRIIREEQAEMLQEQNEKKVAKREEMQEKFKAMAEKHEESQKKRLEEWIKKYSEKAGLTIAQENGILDAYKWAQDERRHQMEEKMKDGGPMMVTPADFEKMFEQRDERIKELLTEAQYKGLVDYRDKNPFPEMMMYGAIGDHGDEMGAEIIMTAPTPIKRDKENEEDK